jgi:hypothetical protein
VGLGERRGDGREVGRLQRLIEALDRAACGIEELELHARHGVLQRLALRALGPAGVGFDGGHGLGEAGPGLARVQGDELVAE